MKKKFILLCSIILGLFLSFNAQAADGLDNLNIEKIDNFSVTIRINEDASLDVSEKIEYNFGAMNKHGIIRDIPVNYKARGGNFNLRISDIKVEDENGSEYSFSNYYSGSNFSIKIGDANKFVNGKKIYIINYKINRAINYFDTYDELYWNVTGNEWTVPIESAEANIVFPQVIADDQVQKTCFAGLLGGKNLCSSTEFVLSGNLVQGVRFKQNFSLAPAQGFTVVVGVPKKVVLQPSIVDSYLEIIKDNWIIILPFITLFAMYYLWLRRGRDPKGRDAIIAQYGPPDSLTPGEVGTIIDERADDKDVSANIINLAVNGYLKIIATENKWGFFSAKDYYLEKLKEGDILSEFDKKLMEGLFKTGSKVKLSELKNKFYEDLKEIKDKIYEVVVAKGYFPENPNRVRAKYIGIGVLIIILNIFVNMFLIDFWGFMGLFSFIFSGVIIIIFGFIMPVKTKKGVEAKEYILGFKDYLSVAEKDRINFHNAPEKNPERFEKLLPYAMVLGVEKEWAKQFEGIYNESPSWYSDSSGVRFNAVILVSNLSNFSLIARSNLSSRPSSSSHGAAGGHSGFGGGGFSGGGFGGGGGRSW